MEPTEITLTLETLRRDTRYILDNLAMSFNIPAFHVFTGVERGNNTGYVFFSHPSSDFEFRREYSLSERQRLGEDTRVVIHQPNAVLAAKDLASSVLQSFMSKMVNNTELVNNEVEVITHSGAPQFGVEANGYNIGNYHYYDELVLSVAPTPGRAAVRDDYPLFSSTHTRRLLNEMIEDMGGLNNPLNEARSTPEQQYTYDSSGRSRDSNN